jgi:hypothetical protein
MKMPQVEAEATSGDVIPIPESLVLKKLPCLSDLLLNPVWDGGVSKGQRSMMLFLEGSIVKVLIKVERQRLKAMVSGRGVDEALAGWEALLKAGNVPWEQEQETTVRGSKKR